MGIGNGVKGGVKGGAKGGVKGEKKKFSYEVSPSAVNFIIIFLFLFYIVFSSGESSVRSKIDFSRERDDIELEISRIREKMVQDSLTLKKIWSDDKFLERYAREKIFMSGKGEIIFKIK